jgi:acyl dehydratase
MKKYQHLKIGQSAEMEKQFSQNEIEKFAILSNDGNPLHLDEDFARNSIFGKPIVHGMLVASLFSGLLGQELPGPGSIYLGQTLKFTKPVFIGEIVIATVEITQINEENGIIHLDSTCRTIKSGIVISGESIVMFKG